MIVTRKIKKVLKSKPAIEGAGVHLKRAFGFSEAPMFDPFLLFDDFRSDHPDHYLKGFPWHPHRGIETITYVLAGDVEHGDSLGNKGIIGSGDVQWMTAGGGIMHEEMPRPGEDRRMGGFQLWVNLPAAEKMTAPRYQDLAAASIPEVRRDDGTIVRVVAGTLILLSLALGIPGSPIFVSAWWLAFTAFVGANLLQSAFTGLCPLALILRKLGVQPGAAF